MEWAGYTVQVANVFYSRPMYPNRFKLLNNTPCKIKFITIFTEAQNRVVQLLCQDILAQYLGFFQQFCLQGLPATGDTASLQGPKGNVVGISGCYHIRLPICTVKGFRVSFAFCGSQMWQSYNFTACAYFAETKTNFTIVLNSAKGIHCYNSSPSP